MSYSWNGPTRPSGWMYLKCNLAHDRRKSFNLFVVQDARTPTSLATSKIFLFKMRSSTGNLRCFQDSFRKMINLGLHIGGGGTIARRNTKSMTGCEKFLVRVLEEPNFKSVLFSSDLWDMDDKDLIVSSNQGNVYLFIYPTIWALLSVLSLLGLFHLLKTHR